MIKPANISGISLKVFILLLSMIVTYKISEVYCAVFIMINVCNSIRDAFRCEGRYSYVISMARSNKDYAFLGCNIL
jgi:hypothetical protein